VLVRLSRRARGRSASGEFPDRVWGISWPPAGNLLTAYGEDLTSADTVAAACSPNRQANECH